MPCTAKGSSAGNRSGVATGRRTCHYQTGLPQQPPAQPVPLASRSPGSATVRWSSGATSSSSSGWRANSGTWDSSGPHDSSATCTCGGVARGVTGRSQRKQGMTFCEVVGQAASHRPFGPPPRMLRMHTYTCAAHFTSVQQRTCARMAGGNSLSTSSSCGTRRSRPYLQGAGDVHWFDAGWKRVASVALRPTATRVQCKQTAHHGSLRPLLARLAARTSTQPQHPI